MIRASLVREANPTKAQNKSLKDWVTNLPGASKAPHRFGGTEFSIRGLEFMHFHGPSYLDIRLSKTDQEQVLREGRAQEHGYAPQAGWVTFIIRSEEDIPKAQEIIQLAYSNAKRIVESHTARRANQTILSSSRTPS